MLVTWESSYKRPHNTRTGKNVIFSRKSYNGNAKTDESAKFAHLNRRKNVRDAITQLDIYEFLKGDYNRTNTKFFPNYFLNAENMALNSDYLDSHYGTDKFTLFKSEYDKMLEMTGNLLKNSVGYLSPANAKFEGAYVKFNSYFNRLEDCISLFKYSDIFNLAYLGIVDLNINTLLYEVRASDLSNFVKLNENGIKNIAVNQPYRYNRTAEDLAKENIEFEKNDRLYLEVVNNLFHINFTMIESLIDLPKVKTVNDFNEAVTLITNVQNSVLKFFGKNIGSEDYDTMLQYVDGKTTASEMTAKIFTDGNLENQTVITQKMLEKLITDPHTHILKVLWKKYGNDNINIQSSGNYLQDTPYLRFNRLIVDLSRATRYVSTVENLETYKMYIGVIYSYLNSTISYGNRQNKLTFEANYGRYIDKFDNVGGVTKTKNTLFNYLTSARPYTLNGGKFYHEKYNLEEPFICHKVNEVSDIILCELLRLNDVDIELDGFGTLTGLESVVFKYMMIENAIHFSDPERNTFLNTEIYNEMLDFYSDELEGIDLEQFAYLLHLFTMFHNSTEDEDVVKGTMVLNVLSKQVNYIYNRYTTLILETDTYLQTYRDNRRGLARYSSSDDTKSITLIDEKMNITVTRKFGFDFFIIVLNRQDKYKYIYDRYITITKDLNEKSTDFFTKEFESVYNLQSRSNKLDSILSFLD